jgi:hypothetical protein
LKVRSLHHSVVDKRLQFPAQDAGRYLRRSRNPSQEPFPNLSEAERPIPQIPEEPQFVLAADHALKLGDRAGLSSRGSGRRHKPIFSRCVTLSITVAVGDLGNLFVRT